MREQTSSVRLSFEVELGPLAAFETVVDELTSALERQRTRFDAGTDGRVTQANLEMGRVISWEPGKRILLQWKPANWDPSQTTEVELRFEPANGRTTVTLEHRGWGRLIGGPEEQTGWFTGQVIAPFLGTISPEALGDWLTDRGARQPSGAQARAVYRDPLYHYPNFRVILQELSLREDDYLLEVGCGGGALLKEALKSGCRAAAVDHSPDMVRLARETNCTAVAEGRLEVHEATADRLSFPDSSFTCAAMTGVLGFLSDPVAALAEIRRVLRPGGRFVALGSDPELKGTPGAPEPFASRLRFYDDDELEQLGRSAGFDEVHAVRRDLGPFAREAGIPEEHLPLFSGSNTRFLLARKR